jgi:hypothetical protein
VRRDLVLSLVLIVSGVFWAPDSLDLTAFVEPSIESGEGLQPDDDDQSGARPASAPRDVVGSEEPRLYCFVTGAAARLAEMGPRTSALGPTRYSRGPPCGLTFPVSGWSTPSPDVVSVVPALVVS